jgi:hypothetical protein
MTAGGGAGAAGPGTGRSLAAPAFPNDDGTADPGLRGLIAASDPSLIEVLSGQRLLVAVKAVADEVDETGADKSSHMAIVSMVNASGEKGLLAFTGLDSMALWDPAARPVPVTALAAAQAALDDGATALVIDVLGPVRLAITGDLLNSLAAITTPGR